MLRIVGDSHVVALKKFTSEGGDVVVDFVGPGSSLWEMMSGNEIRPKYQQYFNAPAETRAVLLGSGCWGFLCVKQNPSEGERLDFDIAEYAESFSEDKPIFPENMIREFFESRLDVLSKLLRSANVPFFISGPPPSENDNVIRAAYAKRSVQVLLAPPRQRLHCWTIQREVLRNIAEGAGAVFIDAPSESFDENGFLKREFYHDGVHGNLKYSELLFKKILSITGAAVPS